MGTENASAFFQNGMCLPSFSIQTGCGGYVRVVVSAVLFENTLIQIHHYWSAYGSTAWMSNGLSLNSQFHQTKCMHFLYNLAGSDCIDLSSTQGCGESFVWPLIYTGMICSAFAALQQDMAIKVRIQCDSKNAFVLKISAFWFIIIFLFTHSGTWHCLNWQNSFVLLLVCLFFKYMQNYLGCCKLLPTLHELIKLLCRSLVWERQSVFLVSAHTHWRHIADASGVNWGSDATDYLSERVSWHRQTDNRRETLKLMWGQFCPL